MRVPSHQYRIPRSGAFFHFAPSSLEATARVTTFSFPLFCLSGAPPGRFFHSGAAAYAAALRHRKSASASLLHPACAVIRPTVPGGLPTSALSGCPVRGCRRIYSPHPTTSSLFYEFFRFFLISLIFKHDFFVRKARLLPTPPLPCPFPFAFP